VRLLYAIVLVALALLLVAFLLLVRPAWADVIDDAFRLCAAAKQTGMTSQCEVKGGSRAIEMTIDTTSAEARKMCVGIVGMMAKQTRSFASKWELRIFSPYGPRPIASCTLQ
jgi:hypothetical protein